MCQIIICRMIILKRSRKKDWARVSLESKVSLITSCVTDLTRSYRGGMKQTKNGKHRIHKAMRNPLKGMLIHLDHCCNNKLGDRFDTAPAHCLAIRKHYEPQQFAVEALALYARSKCLTSVDLGAPGPPSDISIRCAGVKCWKETSYVGRSRTVLRHQSHIECLSKGQVAPSYSIED